MSFPVESLSPQTHKGTIPLNPNQPGVETLGHDSVNVETEASLPGVPQGGRSRVRKRIWYSPAWQPVSLETKLKSEVALRT